MRDSTLCLMSAVLFAGMTIGFAGCGHWRLTSLSAAVAASCAAGYPLIRHTFERKE